MVLPSSIASVKPCLIERVLSDASLINLQVVSVDPSPQLKRATIDKKCDKVLKQLYRGDHTPRAPDSIDQARRLSVTHPKATMQRHSSLPSLNRRECCRNSISSMRSSEHACLKRITAAPTQSQEFGMTLTPAFSSRKHQFQVHNPKTENQKGETNYLRSLM